MKENKTLKSKKYLTSIAVFKQPLFCWWEIHNKIKYFFGSIRCMFMRAKYGFSYRDVWNLDYYLATVIENSVRYLRYNHSGYPTEFNPKQDFLDEEDSAANEKWEKVLDDIANAFHNCLEENCDNTESYTPYAKLKYVDKLPEDNEQLIEAKNNWLKEMEDREKYFEEQKNHGFDLLKQWFFNLWD